MTTTLDKNSQRILVVDDEASISELISTSLRFVGFDVRTAANGAEALRVAEDFKPHAMVLDVMLPDLDGFEVCKKIRNEGVDTGVLFLTAKDGMDDKVKGLTLGGDDYMTKPFSLEELVARLRALLRRTGVDQIEIDDEKMRFADLELDEATHEVRRAGELLDLSPTEFALLRYLIINADRVVSKAQILDHVWQYDFRGDMGIVETYISYLRKKVDAFEPPLIHTVRGVGYRLRMPPKQSMRSRTLRVDWANSSLRNRLTIGVLVLSAIGFVGAGVGSQALLRNYLIHQVDDQLLSVIAGTEERLDRAGIARDADDDDQPSTQTVTPLNRVPTSISVTVLDPFGNLVGGIGGDFNSNQITDYVKGLLPGQVAAYGSKPFTIEAPGADFRVATTVLPSSLGSVIVAQSLADFDKTTHQIAVVFLIIGGLVLLFIAFASRQVIKVGMRPLERIEETAEKIAAGDLSARLDNYEPDTEVGRLSTSLNIMLSRIEEAFDARMRSEDKLRRFVADASHELRTPLTAIRGFAELHRQGAVPEGEKTNELIARIEKESMRMGYLVEDLLMLARLDQSRELVFADVDLSALLQEAVTSAQAAGPEHTITTNIASGITTKGDADKIYQVVTNLLANARAHTPAGTAISVTVAKDGADSLVTIADNGPGLTAEDQARIFERFYRVDASRQRNSKDGSGLGLSIVDAVMRAHGGDVTVASELGKGAAFTLRFKG